MLLRHSLEITQKQLEYIGKSTLAQLYVSTIFTRWGHHLSIIYTMGSSSKHYLHDGVII